MSFVFERAVLSFFAIKNSTTKNTPAKAGVIIWFYKSNKHNCIYKSEIIIEMKINNKEKNCGFMNENL